jgi:hypothetical protein
MEIHFLDGGFVQSREGAQGFDDGANPIGPYFHRLDYSGEIVGHKVQVNLLSLGLNGRIGDWIAFLVEGHQLHQVGDVVLGVGQVAGDEVNRVVDFVGDARHQLPQPRELFALNEMGLGATQIAEGAL